MKFRPYATLTLTLICLIVTIASQAFNTSLFFFDGSPEKWLSYFTVEPFRHYGLTIVLSPFMHISSSHLLVNLFFLIPISLLIERKKSGQFLIIRFTAIHLITLIFLTLFASGNQAFLGASHLICGLGLYWSLNRRQWSLLALIIAFVGLGFWEGQNSATILAHGAGALAGALVLVLDQIRSKIRS